MSVFTGSVQFERAFEFIKFLQVFYKSNFRSPLRIQPSLRMSSLNSKVIRAGKMKQHSTSPSQANQSIWGVLAMTPRGPTKPQVPIMKWRAVGGGQGRDQ